MKIIYQSIICFCIVGRLSALVENPAFGEDVSDKGIATVTLEVPYPTRLAGESSQFIVRLRNDSDADLPYYPSSNVYAGSGKQLFIIVDRRDLDHEKRSAMYGEKRRDYQGQLINLFRTVQEHGNWDVVKKEATGVLRPKETVVLCRGFDLEDFDVYGGNPRSIQAQVLVGPGKWVSSKTVPIHVIPGNVKDFPKVFRDSIIVNAQAGTSHEVFFYRGEVAGKDYLFDMGRFRICEIPKGATPKFKWDAATGLLAISFDGTKEPPVLFSYWKRSILKEE